MEERGSSGETAAHCISIAEVIDFLQTLTLAYIMLRAREITKKKKPKPKATTRDKMGRNQKKCNKQPECQKAGEQWLLDE